MSDFVFGMDPDKTTFCGGWGFQCAVGQVVMRPKNGWFCGVFKPVWFATCNFAS